MAKQSAFFASASRLMRNILVDYARSKLAGKRGGVQFQVTLADDLLASDPPSIEVLAVHEALEQLAHFDPRQVRIVEMHRFGGLGFDEIAFLPGLSARTIKRDWCVARAWLACHLSGKA